MSNNCRTAMERFLREHYLHCDYMQLGAVIQMLAHINAHYGLKFRDVDGEEITYEPFTSKTYFWQNELVRLFRQNDRQNGAKSWTWTNQTVFKVDIDYDDFIIRVNTEREPNNFNCMADIISKEGTDSEQRNFNWAYKEAMDEVKRLVRHGTPYKKSNYPDDHEEAVEEEPWDTDQEDKQEPQETHDIHSDISNKEREENKDMKDVIPNLKIGKISDGSVKMSHLGIAVKNTEGTYVSYDRINNKIVDVDIVSFDGDSFLFYMPVQMTDIKIGDTILHNGKACYVTGVQPTLKAVSLADGCTTNVMVTTNLFGFNFVTKIMSLIDFTAMSGGDPSGNMMWPLLLASKNGENNDDMLLAMFMMQMQQSAQANQQNGVASMGMFNNPMIMFALMDNNKEGGSSNDNLKMFMLMQMFQQQAALQAQMTQEPGRRPVQGVGEMTGVGYYNNGSEFPQTNPPMPDNQ